MDQTLTFIIVILNAALAVAGIILILRLQSRVADRGTAEAAGAAAQNAAAAQAAITAAEPRLTSAIVRSEQAVRGTIDSQLGAMRQEHQQVAHRHRVELTETLTKNQAQAILQLTQLQTTTKTEISAIRQETTATLGKSAVDLRESLERMRSTVELQLKELRGENQKKLDEMRGVVDKQLNETLQSRLGKAFDSVTTKLQELHQQLGQVQSLATDVTGLRRTLEGVKTRGVFGEVMLEGMLQEFLHPSQYDRNFKPRPRSGESVEFAIRLPNRGQDGSDEPVWMPIDAKFPRESYERLILAVEAGDADAAASERKALLSAIMGFARDIRDKYIAPPRTTAFAILYLPLESLFAEVVREPGFIERLQSECRVTLASPTTLGAYLNALQMGFQTLAVQKQSAEIQKLLEAVRAQIATFGTELAKAQRKLEESRRAVAATVHRTSVIDKRLRKVDVATPEAVAKLLPAGDLIDAAADLEEADAVAGEALDQDDGEERAS
ncbi:MAG: DNA recombination protein RmuC [Phycisphaerales bacterium]